MKYSFDSRVRYSEVDENGILSMESLIDYFQDCSTFQSEYLGCGLDYLKKQDLAWILASWQIIPVRMPALCEKITAATWPYEFREFFGMRNFLLTDEEGKTCAMANSVWVLLNISSQRPVRPDEEMLRLYGTDEKLDMHYASRKIRLPAGKPVAEKPFVIARHHLDTNHHVNNGQYIRMAMEYLPPSFTIGQMRADYRMQARLDDTVCPMVYQGEGSCTVALNGSGGKTFAVVEFT